MCRRLDTALPLPLSRICDLQVFGACNKSLITYREDVIMRGVCVLYPHRIQPMSGVSVYICHGLYLAIDIADAM